MPKAKVERSPMTWADAYEIAYHAMGTEEVRAGGRNGRRLQRRVHRADEDPLAAHCLAEWILTKAHGAKDLSGVRVS